MCDSNSVETFNLDKLDFISKPRFLAAKDHFEKVIGKIKDDEHLTEIAAEFANLLHLFETCFKESLKKTQKLFEMRALDAAKSKRARSMSPVKTTTVEDLKKDIRILLRDLHEVNNERINLLKEVEELKKAADTQNRTVQVHERSLGNIPVDIGVSCDLISDDHKITNGSKETYLRIQFKEEDDSAETLKNNLNLLVLDLKITRQKIEDLKKEVRSKDYLIRKLNKDISGSEKILTEFETKTSEISKPMELKVAKYKTELRAKQEKFETVSEALEKAQLLNEQLNVDIAAKDSLIDGLKIKLEELEAARASAARNSEMFEKHLARSQNHSKELISEMKILEEEIQSLKHKPTKDFVNGKTRSQVVESREGAQSQVQAQDQEKAIENLKRFVTIVSRDQKLRQTEKELSATNKILQNLKRDFNTVSQEKSNLQIQIIDLQKKLDDKTEDMKYLKEKFFELQKESNKIKRELMSFARKHKQVIESRDKFHCKYNHMKFVNSQQKKENSILRKKLEYLIKIIKEKDIEMEKLLTLKRYIK